MIILEKSDTEEQQTVVRKVKRSAKSNPNIQYTKNLEKKQKLDEGSGSSSDNENFRVSYKSNKSAMPAGPSDQGATATIVSPYSVSNLNIIHKNDSFQKSNS